MIRLQSAFPTSRAALLAAGFTTSEIQQSVRNGSIVRIEPGVYANPDAVRGFREQKFRQRSIAAAVKCPGQILSHSSAIAYYTLPLVRTDLTRVHLTRPGRNGSTTTTHHKVHAATVLDSEIIAVEGIRVTTVARSLIDFARSERLDGALVAMDSALKRALVTAFDLEESLMAAAHRKGSPAARRALSLASPHSESAGETLTRLEILRAGLPLPSLQVRFWDSVGSFVGRVDLAYPEFGLIIEFDGEEKYRKPADGRTPAQVVIDEKRREDALRALGYTVIRLVWRELFDQRALAAFLAQVKCEIERGRIRLATTPCLGRFELAE